jgi:hypothetical protein
MREDVSFFMAAPVGREREAEREKETKELTEVIPLFHRGVECRGQLDVPVHEKLRLVFQVSAC